MANEAGLDLLLNLKDVVGETLSLEKDGIIQFPKLRAAFEACEVHEDKHWARPAHAVRERIPTGLAEFDRTIGGGLMEGSVILLSRHLGAGGTTLTTEVADGVATSTKRPVLFVSTEQSASDLCALARRIGVENERVEILASVGGIDVAWVINRANEIKPALIVLDSLKSITSSHSKGQPGSPGQGMMVMEAIVDYCKKTKTAAIVINHMTKEGFPAGGTTLQHHADTCLVLAFPRSDDKEAPDGENVRVLLVDGKNRHGRSYEKSYWKMTGEGLRPII